jgi:hypothetical protein
MCETIHSGPFRGRAIPLAETVGMMLSHDVTEITDCFKGPAFRKGHVVRETDLEHLARLGKEHLWVLDVPEGMLHEDDAALLLARALSGPGVTFDPRPSEGKINLVAAHDGLLKVNAEALTAFNMVEGVMCAGRHTDTLVRRGDRLAGTRAIPLVIDRETVHQAVGAAALSAGGVFSVKELARPRTGLIITGGEVYHGRIQDRFEPMLRPKLEGYGCSILGVEKVPDDVDRITRAIWDMLADGAGLLILTGGMSVDPDDVTRVAVAMAGASDIRYGSAVLPGAMLLLAEIQGVPVIGVPACGLHHRITVLDLVLPRILAGERLNRKDLAAMGHGGLCLDCPECRYPVCPFGKG